MPSRWLIVCSSIIIIIIIFAAATVLVLFSASSVRGLAPTTSSTSGSFGVGWRRQVDGHVHHEDGEEGEEVRVVEYEPVRIRLFNERRLTLTVPEAVINALDEWLGLKLPRVPKAVHDPPPLPDAPTLPGGVLDKGTAPTGRMRLRQGGGGGKVTETVPGEWLVMVHKAYRSDFVAVLEDLGDHLHTRFGMSAWRDAASDARRAWREHAERQRKRQEIGESEERFMVDIRDDSSDVLALEIGKRMMMKVTIPPEVRHRETELLESLRQKEWTEFIEPNQAVRKTTTLTTQTLPISPYNWGLDRIDQRSLPLNTQYRYPSVTSNVRIYIVDTGVRLNHTEFGGRALWGNNFIDSTNTDCDGHGTHVAGIAAGTTVGVAKQATIYAVKVLDCNGDGTTLSVVLGIYWATTHCGSNKCVISLSLGGDTSNAIDSAVQAAYESGIVSVSAAGNSNEDACLSSPARTKFTITVGATTAIDGQASYSNWGTCVDILAPGSQITSAMIGSTTSVYSTVSGTSQATPFVSGAAALLLAQQSGPSNPSQIAGAIFASASLNKITQPDDSTVNRLLYSLVNLGDVPATPAAACGNPSTCTTISGRITTAPKEDTLPATAISVSSSQAATGYFQGWLTATADFDLKLQFYNNTLATWITLITSSGSSGVEWIQYSTAAKGAGFYRWVVSAGAGETGNYTLAYHAPTTVWQEGGSSAAAALPLPFWLSWLTRP